MPWVGFCPSCSKGRANCVSQTAQLIMLGVRRWRGLHTPTLQAGNISCHEHFLLQPICPGSRQQNPGVWYLHTHHGPSVVASGPCGGGCSAPLTCPTAGSSLGLESGNPCRDSLEGLHVYTTLTLCLNS